MRNLRLLLAVPALLVACAPRQSFVEVPTFKVESVRLQSITLPTLGGGVPASATLSVQLRVQNPNAFPVRLRRVTGNVFFDGNNVGNVELPNIDLPARGEAQQEAIVGLPITLANLGEFLQVARGQAVSYRLDGTFTVDAGLFGQPSFGPYTLSQGVIKQPRILP